MTLNELAARLDADGITCISIRTPINGGDFPGQWSVNVRCGDAPWQPGRPCKSIEGAINSLFPSAIDGAETDETLADLLGD